MHHVKWFNRAWICIRKTALWLKIIETLTVLLDNQLLALTRKLHIQRHGNISCVPWIFVSYLKLATRSGFTRLFWYLLLNEPPSRIAVCIGEKRTDAARDFVLHFVVTKHFLSKTVSYFFTFCCTWQTNFLTFFPPVLFLGTVLGQPCPQPEPQFPCPCPCPCQPQPPPPSPCDGAQQIGPCNPCEPPVNYIYGQAPSGKC